MRGIFKDKHGAEWRIVINVETMRRVRSMCELELASLVDDCFRKLGDLIVEPVKFAEVLYAIVHDQAQSRGVTQAEFERAIDGEAMREATHVFAQELVDFFHGGKARVLLARARNKVEAQKMAEMDRAIAQLSQIEFGPSSGASPESQVSTQGPTPCES